MNVYGLLGIPAVYRASQAVLAPGMDVILERELKPAVAEISKSARVLDVGCGPASWLRKFAIRPVGVDISFAYMRQFGATGSPCLTGSAAALPLASNSFDAVFSAALLHHLPDSLAAATVDEMLRVTRPGGLLIVFDPVLPKAAWRRPQAWALCKLDRGRFIRRQAHLESGILRHPQWKTRRFPHSYLGTEGLLCTLKKDFAT